MNVQLSIALPKPNQENWLSFTQRRNGKFQEDAEHLLAILNPYRQLILRPDRHQDCEIMVSSFNVRQPYGTFKQHSGIPLGSKKGFSTVQSFNSGLFTCSTEFTGADLHFSFKQIHYCWLVLDETVLVSSLFVNVAEYEDADVIGVEMKIDVPTGIGVLPVTVENSGIPVSAAHWEFVNGPEKLEQSNQVLVSLSDNSTLVLNANELVLNQNWEGFDLQLKAENNVGNLIGIKKVHLFGSSVLINETLLTIEFQDPIEIPDQENLELNLTGSWKWQ